MVEEFLVVKDDEGILRPQAGIWRNNEAGKISAKDYSDKNLDIKVVLVELKEVIIKQEKL